MSLAENTETALDESRTLMLGAQILLGFQLQAPFQNAFVSLMWHEKAIEVAVLCILVLVLGLLIAPSARQRIVGQGEATAGKPAAMGIARPRVHGQHVFHGRHETRCWPSAG